jgi:UDP-glucose 4-epimerase
MNVLVVGGAGFVGSVCAEQLLAAGHTVLVVDNLSTGHREAVSPSASFVEGDFGNQELIRDVVRKYHVDAVMHFAGETLVEKSMTDPRVYFQNNVRKGLDLLDTLLECGIKKFVFSSTAAVYGEPVATPIAETHPKAPINAYGESKLIFERILEWYGRAYGLRYAALRYFNAAGASQHFGEDHNPESHLLPRILDCALDASREFVIYGDDYTTPDGSCVRDYVHVLDIAQAHIRAMDALDDGQHQGAYNIGSSQGYSVREVVRTVEDVTGRKLRIRVGSRRAGDPAILVATHDRVVRELGWKPRFSDLQDIVQSAWDWKRKHPQGYVAVPKVTEELADQNK